MFNPVVPFGVPVDQSQTDLQLMVPREPLRLQANFNDMATTVYVGHICNRVPDESVRELLDICGKVNKWTRHPDPSTGKWAHFGFCEFNKLEGAWRAVELLDGRQLGSKNLVVKADAKIQERIAAFGVTHRLSRDGEERIRATVNAWLTTINSKWREVAMATDAQLQQEDLKPQTKQEVPTFVSVADNPNDFVFPDWYRPSRRETDRVSRIERRRRDRESDFKKALYDWEHHDEKRLLRDMERDAEDTERMHEKKRKLIEQDGGETVVRSNFSRSDRRREIESDERDRVSEEKEIASRKERDAAELLDLETRLTEICTRSPLASVSVLIDDDDRPLDQFPSSYRALVKRLPKSTNELEKFSLNYEAMWSESTVLKFRFWLKRKLRRLIALSEEETTVIANFIVKRIEMENPNFACMREILLKCTRFNERHVDELSKKIFQLLAFSQLAVGDSR